jgi:hypothetical protein
LGTALTYKNCIHYEISAGQDLPSGVDTYSNVQLRGFWEKTTLSPKLNTSEDEKTFPAWEPVHASGHSYIVLMRLHVLQQGNTVNYVGSLLLQK